MIGSSIVSVAVSVIVELRLLWKAVVDYGDRSIPNKAVVYYSVTAHQGKFSYSTVIDISPTNNGNM